MYKIPHKTNANRSILITFHTINFHRVTQVKLKSARISSALVGVDPSRKVGIYSPTCRGFPIGRAGLPRPRRLIPPIKADSSPSISRRSHLGRLKRLKLLHKPPVPGSIGHRAGASPPVRSEKIMLAWRGADKSSKSPAPLSSPARAPAVRSARRP